MAPSLYKLTAGAHTIGPDNALRTEHHSNGSVNRSNIKDEAVDKLIDDAISENDNEKRKELYAEAQQHIVSNSYWIPLAIEQINAGIKSTVKGFEVPMDFSIIGVIYIS